MIDLVIQRGQTGGVDPFLVLNLAPQFAPIAVEQVAQDDEGLCLEIRAQREAAAIAPSPHERVLHEVVGCGRVVRE